MRFLVFGLPVLLIACASSDAPADYGAGGSGAEANSGGESGVTTSTSAGSAGSTVVGVAGAPGNGTGGSNVVGNAAAGSGGTGGASGSGGTGGSSGASGGGGNVPPMRIGSCADLAAPGKWQKINPPDANPKSTFDDGLTGDVRTDPIDSGTVYVAVKGFGLYKSTDCGATWSKLNTGRNADMVKRGTSISVQIDPIDPKVIYLNSLYGDGGVWKSINGGKDWDQMLDTATMNALNGGFISFVMIDPDPRFHEHLLASPHDACHQAPWPGCIAESYDAGKTWTLIQAPVSGETVGPIFVGGQTFLFTSGGLSLTTDGGHTWTHVADGVSYGAGSNLYRASDGAYYTPSQHGAFTSKDLHNWTELGFGRSLGFASGDGKMFASDPWSLLYHSASEKSPTTWTTFDPPAELDPAAGYGGIFLRYDPGHHILYSPNFAGGVFRRVIQ